MVKDLFNGKTRENMWVLILMISNRDMEFFSGVMDVFTKENGKAG